MAGGVNFYWFGSNAQNWVDILGLEKSLGQRIDSGLTGMYAEGSATAGLGLAISTEYAGNGKFSCSIALTAGASLEGGVGYSKI